MLHLGVCLPRACDPKDITTLLHATSMGSPIYRIASKVSPKAAPKSFEAPSMEVVRIRRVPGPYVLLADTKLHILA